jgi:hypothetical protein
MDEVRMTVVPKMDEVRMTKVVLTGALDHVVIRA